MKTRKTFFHRAVCMFLTAVMAVTLFTVAAPTEAQAAGLSFKGNGKSTVTIKDTQCYSGRNLYNSTQNAKISIFGDAQGRKVDIFFCQHFSHFRQTT